MPPTAGPSKISRSNTLAKRKSFSHTTVSVAGSARHDLIVMARKLNIKADGDTEVLRQRVQDELKFHPYKWLEKEPVFKTAIQPH